MGGRDLDGGRLGVAVGSDHEAQAAAATPGSTLPPGAERYAAPARNSPRSRIFGQRRSAAMCLVAVSGAVFLLLHRVPLPAPALSQRPATRQTPVTRHLQSCQPGRWRLASPQDLAKSLLSLSHLLIRHEGSVSYSAPLTVLDWKVDLPPSSRTRGQALALAKELAIRAKRAPASFAELARGYSEDPLTKEAGGRLGYLPALELAYWPTVLDCLAELQGKAMTPVVETEFGFHIFVMDPVPPEEEYSARRIVIGYEGASFLQYSVRPEEAGYAHTHRSKAEARSLAERLAAESTPKNFDLLVRRYSDHRDAARGGDLGVWSSREPTHFPRVVEAILAVKAGETTAPVDSELGYQVLLRTQTEARPRYAMLATYHGFDPDAPEGTPLGRTATRSRAEAHASALRRGESLDGQEGQRIAFALGRGPVGLENEVAQIAVGEPVPQPFMLDNAWVVARRVALRDDVPQQILLNRLPAPLRPNPADFVATSPDALRQLLADVTDTMPAGERRVCRRLHRNLLREISSRSDTSSRRAAWADHESLAAGILGRASWLEYRSSVDAWIESRQLQHVSSSVAGAFGG